MDDHVWPCVVDFDELVPIRSFYRLGYSGGGNTQKHRPGFKGQVAHPGYKALSVIIITTIPYRTVPWTITWHKIPGKPVLPVST